MIGGMAEQPANDFVPAAPQLWTYDALSFLLTSARRWRPALIAQIAPSPADVIADIGCGSQAPSCDYRRELAHRADIDRHRSGRRRFADGLAAKLRRGQRHRPELRPATCVTPPILLGGRGVTNVSSSLVFHQVPLEEKRDGLAAIHETLRPGGSLHVDDYGLQRTAKMRKRISPRSEG